MTCDVLIIGGGVGGLACAMTLASAHAKPWFKDRRILIIDDGMSDLGKARLCNAPGVPIGALGSDILAGMRAQALQYGVASLESDRVTTVSRSDERWTVTAASGRAWTAATLVLATGFKRWEIEGLACTPSPHPRGGKPDRIMLEHDGVYCVSEELRVAGLLGGGSSQFAIAAGAGAQTAVEILCVWAGKRTHIHDVPEPPEC
ncbi:MAG: FAD-dependent oxidoreductase [Phycisphaerales bacterium]|jgi:glycine/D-amino acid oxidase-like deaminating enzyme|nr:FAD-dependent oxidoreductase [Phycisphaerales bacterium]